MNETKIPLTCQVRSKTESPCLRTAVVEILGVAFCDACAREQEAYFAIGELTQEETEGLRDERLAAALKRMRRERTGGKERILAEMDHWHSSVHENKPISLTKN